MSGTSLIHHPAPFQIISKIHSSLTAPIAQIRPTAPLNSSPSNSNLSKDPVDTILTRQSNSTQASEDISNSPTPTSSDIKSSFTTHADEKPAR
ncbi:hypothetical protein BOTNAR_0036g00360 [Botryotinia narcissicola]|uniref:Uncharacterized protein n=1 Tax=Botryotinia narcissicola TaxID=278944 RepID=A0A4Z1J239_9HELO|nr:hypothetical protein BOTNAR_0036g00360 [Botryotinia narcissicola]